MKKIKLFLLPLFVSTLATSQNIVVEYQQTFVNSSLKLDVKYDLFITDTISIYLEKENINTDNKKTTTEDNQTTYILDTNVKTNKNVFYNNRKNFLFKSTFFSNYLKIKEDSLDLNWKYIDSTKRIGSYICKLASKEFRGRKYYAWYTEEIPTFFGPWKFHNLNGLVIQVYDEKKEFEINALKIIFGNIKSYKKIAEISKSFTSGSKPLTINDLKQYIDEKNEMILSNIRRQLPRGVVMPVIDKDCEECDKPLERY